MCAPSLADIRARPVRPPASLDSAGGNTLASMDADQTCGGRGDSGRPGKKDGINGDSPKFFLDLSKSMNP